MSDSNCPECGAEKYKSSDGWECGSDVWSQDVLSGLDNVTQHEHFHEGTNCLRRQLATQTAENATLKAQLAAVKAWEKSDILAYKGPTLAALLTPAPEALAVYNTVIWRDRKGGLWNDKPKRWTECLDVVEVVLPRNGGE